MSAISTREFPVRRIEAVSSKSFARTIADLTASVGRPDISAFRRALTASQTTAEVDAIVREAVGPSGLMEFDRFDSGEIARKGEAGPMIVRLLIGNPAIMSEMARAIPEAAGHAPVTILVREEVDGVHISYDSMESLLHPYGSGDALRVAAELDEKVMTLMRQAVG